MILGQDLAPSLVGIPFEELCKQMPLNIRGLSEKMQLQLEEQEISDGEIFV